MKPSNLFPIWSLVLIASSVIGCAKKEEAIAPMATVNAAVLMGPSRGTTLARVGKQIQSGLTLLTRLFGLDATPARASFLPALGTWSVTPNRVKFRILEIDIMSSNNIPSAVSSSPGSSKSVAQTVVSNVAVDCEVIYDSSLPSSQTLANCPVQVQEGSYSQISILTDSNYQILVDDSVNGIYSDPASPSGFSPTPAAGAGFINFPVARTEFIGPNGPITGGAYTTTFLDKPLAVDSSGTAQISLVINGIHTLHLDVSPTGIAVSKRTSLGQPIEILPIAGGVGALEAYSANATAGNYLPSKAAGVDLFVIYDSDGNVVHLERTTGMTVCNAEQGMAVVMNVAAEDFQLRDGMRNGGYLGIDTSGVIAFANATTGSWEQYYSYLEMNRITTIGDQTQLKCHILGQDESIPQPLAGKTYASGAPGMSSVDDSETLTLVAK